MTGLVMLPSLEFFGECDFRQVKQLSQKVWAGRKVVTAESSRSGCGERRYLTQKQPTSQAFTVVRGYLAIENGQCIGACGFKSPPQNNRVEIAYFTFPEHEARGVATRMTSELIRLALDTKPAVTVAAQTLPEENASTSILKKLRFRLVGVVEHPEDGLVWESQLSDNSQT